MATKKTPPKTFTVTEAAKELGVTRAAIHEAIRKGRLEADWGETVQIIEVRKKSRTISVNSLQKYRVSLAHQQAGKKTS
jgi:predicted DNA-binding protein YlxM (UPF0122 family)